MHPLVQDLRFGARLFAKSPGFSATALAALALGMGATSAIFSVVDAVLLKPLPFRDPERLVLIWEKNPSLNRYRMYAAEGNFREWRDQSRSFEGVAAFQSARITLTGSPNGHIEPEELRAQRVTASLFPLLGVQPVLGRVFLPEEDRPGPTAFALLSHSLWERRFGRDPNIAGKQIQLANRSHTVVGVLPPRISLLDSNVEIWLPLGLNPADPRALGARDLRVIGRVKPERGLEGAKAELQTIGDRLERANPALNTGWRPSVFPLKDEIVGTVRRPLMVLLGAVGLLLLLACANVANLLLARAALRRKEVAIRAALGAVRGRVVRQLLSESVLLAIGGGILGLILAWGSIMLLGRFAARSIPRIADARLDGRIFLFTLGLSLLTGVLFGIVPAWQGSAGNLNTALIETGRGGTLGRSGRLARAALVVAEVALTVVVLIGAGLLMRSFLRLRSADPGFRPDGLLTFRLPLGGGRNAAVERRVAFFQQVEDALSTLPGVESVGAVNVLPLTGLGVGTRFAVYGRPAPRPEERPIGLMRSASPGYFRTIGIRLLAGRGFTAADTAEAPPVVMVGETLARRFFPRGIPEAIGSRLILDSANGKVAEIVGVVGDAQPEHMDGEAWPAIYSPYPQAAAVSMSVVVRTPGAPASLASAVQREVHRLDPNQPVADLRSMEAVRNEAEAGPRFNTLVLGVFAVAAFTLAAVGIYGVVAYDVSERTREIGIRMALGAQAGNVLYVVMAQGARLAAIGIAIGLAAAFALTRVMGSMLYGVKAADAKTFAAIAVMIGAMAIAASYLPSRRALALDPATALRHE